MVCSHSKSETRFLPNASVKTTEPRSSKTTFKTVDQLGNYVRNQARVERKIKKEEGGGGKGGTIVVWRNWRLVEQRMEEREEVEVKVKWWTEDGGWRPGSHGLPRGNARRWTTKGPDQSHVPNMRAFNILPSLLHLLHPSGPQVKISQAKSCRLEIFSGNIWRMRLS